MDKKPWYQSKTIWFGLIGVAIVAWNEAIAQGFHLPMIPEWVLAILASLGVYGRATAKTVIG